MLVTTEIKPAISVGIRLSGKFKTQHAIKEKPMIKANLGLLKRMPMTINSAGTYVIYTINPIIVVTQYFLEAAIASRLSGGEISLIINLVEFCSTPCVTYLMVSIKNLTCYLQHFRKKDHTSNVRHL